VDVYSPPFTPLRDWPRRHRLRLEMPSVRAGTPRALASIRWRLDPALLAWKLRRRRYDIVWTQWPAIMGNTLFWRYARALGLRVVHTVHNVLPHEEKGGDQQRMDVVYRLSDALVVHSQSARNALSARFPDTTSKSIIEPLGLYSCYPKPEVDRSTVRQRLAIDPTATVILAFGWVRPYKNIESLIGALAQPGIPPVVLVIAGRETGYASPQPTGGDELARMREAARESGVLDRVRFVPGHLTEGEAADLLAASDIVALPYLESYGSAQLLLAMTTGRYVLATATGGMEEYMASYAAHTLILGPKPEDIADAIRKAVARLPSITSVDRKLPKEWSWPEIARNSVSALEKVLGPDLAR